MPVNYQLSKIYMMANDIDDHVYIGSTAQHLLSSRKSCHNRLSTEMDRNSPLYVAMRQHGVNHFFITLLYMFPCTCKDELEAEEYKVIKQYKDEGKHIYNTRTARCGLALTQATKDKIRKNLVDKCLFGEDALSNVFCYGSLQHSKKGKEGSWKFEWYHLGVKKTKSYGVRIHGYWQSKLMLEDLRRTIYPKWKSNEEIALAEMMNVDIE